MEWAMRMVAESIGDGEIGYRGFEIASDPATAFCQQYKAEVAKLISEDTLTAHPFVLNEYEEDMAGEVELGRTYYELDDHPEVSQAVFLCLGWEPEDRDVLVLIDENTLARMDAQPAAERNDLLREYVLYDLARYFSDTTGFIYRDLLSWTQDVVYLVAAAAILIEKVDQPFEAKTLAETKQYLREQVLFRGFTMLMEGRYDKPNGAALLCSENPGLVTLLEKLMDGAVYHKLGSQPSSVEDMYQTIPKLIENVLAAIGPQLSVKN